MKYFAFARWNQFGVLYIHSYVEIDHHSQNEKIILYRYEFVDAPHFRILSCFKTERSSGKERAFP
jgi:hypothetical protein